MCRESSGEAGEADLLPGVRGGMGGHSAWLRSPLVREDAYSPGAKELKLRFDVREYAPVRERWSVNRKYHCAGGDHGEDGGQQAVGARQA